MAIESRTQSRKTNSPQVKLQYFGQSIWSLILSWQRLDWVLLISIMVLTTFGGLTIYSTELGERHDYSYQHWTISILGLVVVMVLSRWRYQILLRWYWLIYALTNISLIAVMITGVTAKGAQRWIAIAGFNVQPSEFAKIGMVIVLAALLHDRDAADLKTVIRTLAITAIPWALVFLQPDLGTSLVFGVMLISMLYWANAKTGWLILMISPLFSAILYHLYLPGWVMWVLSVAGITWLTLPSKVVSTLSAVAINLGAVELGNFFWGLLKDYQKARLIMFLDPEQDPLGGGYHLIQSRIAIGAGKMWGQGWHQGTQTQLDFIPEQHTDFIFSAVGEEFGFVGSIVLLGVLWLICMRLVWIACTAKDNFGSLLAIGILAIVAFQVVINLSMTIGLAPITGIPLPWMSYGRSSLLSGFLSIGIVESVANHREIKTRRSY
ncbi:rod shape-determining protein RodA [Waterburya agarophytonicola K14]|uniref:Peptidoglycan glycosyltransferase RodA n=1 Tax=Waterburya agarophytonicola KI4 TaxID=2874699 RepID=A0A964BMV4_9CYAN|nr:rod shape-determining protein RodA [Waterburya agarophytonicola]MCC0175944.1 rod shape-determining protein RodA [Waterburya agarophytonicola KI4]